MKTDNLVDDLLDFTRKIRMIFFCDNGLRKHVVDFFTGQI